MDAHHGHGQEVAKNTGAEVLTLILQREVEIERLLEEAKVEAEKIIEEAKKEAQEIRDKRAEASRVAAAAQQVNVEAAGQQKSDDQAAKASRGAAIESMAMTEEERAQVRELKKRAEQNVGQVVELILQEIIP